jgi:type I restriction enzyme S subunit
MGSDWLEYKLADLCDSIDYGFTTSAKDELVGPKFLRITDIVSGHIDWDDVPYCESDQANTDKYLLYDNDIVIARTGASTGSSMFISAPPKAVFASYLVRLQISDKAYSRFVSYFLKSSAFWAYMRGVLGDKSAQPNASAKTMTQVKLKLPPLPEQRAIAHILGSLDDKIELNRRMNQTLEATARAIFKSWFVDFDPVRAKAEGRPTGLPDDIAALFPDSFEDSELGEIPRGWKVNTVEESAEKVACGPFGSSIKVSTFVPKGVPIISGQHLNGIRLLDQANSFITTEHAEKLKNANVYRGDVIFTHAGNIGQVAFIPETSKYDRYVLSQRQFYLRCNREIVSPFYMAHYFKSPDGQHKLLANTSSTGVPSISRPVSYLKSIKFVLPPKDLIDAFDEYVRPTHLLAAKNDDESNTLASLRDTLLPKLISGELRVPDAEKFVEEAGV